LIDESRVLGALSVVRDPELDEPITELGFVKAVEVDGDSVTVTLQLPTFFCAPNFAYIMAADAKAAVGTLEGVGSCRVSLFDHYVSDEIDEGLAVGKDFDDTFAGETAGTGLTELRSLFDRKSFVSRQELLYRSLIDAGMTRQQAVRLTIRDLPDTPEARRYLERRRSMGVDTSDDAPLLVTPDGEPIAEGDVDRHMRFARTVSVSIEGNASLCRGLLAERYGHQEPKEVQP
jgi:metal-sulfur cluster biosynthetic enzyme